MVVKIGKIMEPVAFTCAGVNLALYDAAKSLDRKFKVK